MNKRMLKKAQKIVINAGRLSDNREQYPLEWLLKNTSGSGYPNNLCLITDAILCMDKEHANYHNLSEEDKAKVEILLKDPEAVRMVICTVFQWFGTNVGKFTIGKLLDEIRELKYTEEEYCKYLKIHKAHKDLITECRKHYNHCHMLCAFFIAYSDEVHL